MNMPGGGTVLNQNVVEIGTARHALATCQFPQFDVIRELPDVPVLSETLLRVELTASERAVDLAWVSRVILSDLGAALQVFRLAEREYGAGVARPRRIEDCVSDLGLHACIEAMSQCTVPRSARNSMVLFTWAHAREIACNAGFLAEEMAGKTTPQDAFIVGLFHLLGTMPALLGWDWECQNSSEDLAGLKLAEAWSLPGCVAEYFSDRLSPGKKSCWINVIERAHQLATATSALCPASY